MTLHYSLDEVVPYINWTYFFHAWGMTAQPQTDCDQLKAEACLRLRQHASHYHTHALFTLYNAHSDGDDIVVEQTTDSDGLARSTSIPCLRQQQQGTEHLCLADYIAPKTDTAATPHPTPYTQIGLFATTADSGMEHDFDDDPYEKMMMQLLADRLAEATAERLHEQVRKQYWGYARGEILAMDDMLCERWQGLRPAVGYPSLPDTSINFILDRLLDYSQIGICLTESGAMRPHASVSGLMIAHPEARYFTVGKIGQDQLHDYARRRGFSTEKARKFLSANL